jgi:hypothetical protein
MATPVQIVVTPGSGDGRAMAIARAVRKQLAKEGYAPRMHVFRTLDDLIRWTKACHANFSYLVSRRDRRRRDGERRGRGRPETVRALCARALGLR